MNEPTQIKVWDPMIRLFHWALVASFAAAYLSEDDWMSVHVVAGYTLLGLLLFRVVWGLVGPRHARFSDFVRPPWEVMAYLKDLAAMRARRYIGHNPAGAAMILALLISLLLSSLTGLGAYGAEGAGPFKDWFFDLNAVGKEALEEIHEFFANFTLFLVAVHIGGVMLGSLLHGENLVRAMFTGSKRG